MKKSTILKMTVVLVMLIGTLSTFGQVTVTTTTSQTKSLIDGTTAPVAATETPDLVTVGTTVPYLVVPDHDLNPSYVLATDGASTTNVLSSFTWNLGGLGSITNASPKHYIEVNVTGTVGTTYTMNVKEANSAPGACTDATGTNIDVKVIAAPAVSAAAVAPTSVCSVDGTTAITLPQFSLTNTTSAPSLAGVKVNATLSLLPLNGGSSTPVFTSQVLDVDASGKVTLPTGTSLSAWGKYTLTINSVSDKISRKDISAALGYFTVTGVSVDFYIYKTAKTGAIYHVSNN